MWQIVLYKAVIVTVWYCTTGKIIIQITTTCIQCSWLLKAQVIIVTDQRRLAPNYHFDIEIGLVNSAKETTWILTPLVWNLKFIKSPFPWYFVKKKPVFSIMAIISLKRELLHCTQYQASFIIPMHALNRQNSNIHTGQHQYNIYLLQLCSVLPSTNVVVLASLSCCDLSLGSASL